MWPSGPKEGEKVGVRPHTKKNCLTGMGRRVRLENGLMGLANKIRRRQTMTRTATMMTVLACALWGVFIAPLAAKHSDQFLLGTYSYLRNNNRPEQREQLYRLMQELGYNSNLVETSEDNSDLAAMLKEMDSHGLDAWLTDKNWNNASAVKTPSSYAMSANNYQRFEAEFSSQRDLKFGDGKDNQYWYAASSTRRMPRTGEAIDIAGASYAWAWQASMGRDRAGWLFTDLRYRWPNRNGAYVRFGREFMLRQLNPSSHENCYLRVNYRFRITDVKKDLPADEPLLRFDVSGYELQGSGFSSQATLLRHLNQGRELTETIYRLNDHLLSPGGDFIELQLRIPYADLLAANLLSTDHDGDASTEPSRELMRLVNLNPRVWWYGNCDVQLDYVEIEDQLHYDLTNNAAATRQGIQNRMRDLMGQATGNLSGFYTFDEPHLGQFEGFKLVQDIAQEAGAKVFTAVYDYQGNNYVLDRRDGLFYDHVDAFRKIAQPQIIAPDIYPLKPELSWDPRDRGDGMFIQDYLDDKLLRVYEESMLYRDARPGRQFYPIVQVLGNWTKRNNGDRWITWIQPPTATQKALLYLPLCYAPDGIFHYRLRVYNDAEGYGNRSLSVSRVGSKNYPEPAPDPIAWPAVASSNHRVLDYGRIIRDLDWLGSETIGTGRVRNSSAQKRNLIKKMQVLRQRNGDYEGYVQCSYYQDGAQSPWFMLVNRRTNFFQPGAITDPRFVPDTEYDSYFPEAEPQILSLRFDRNKIEALGGDAGLYDPHDRMFYPIVDHQVHIQLPAGEGRLLQLVANKPPAGQE